MIYFIQAGDPLGPVKIGYTKRAEGVERRLATFQTCHAEPLYLLAKHEGSLEEERFLHEHFADLRVRGEWFESHRTLVELALSLPHDFRFFLDLHGLMKRLDRLGFRKDGRLTWEGLQYVLVLEKAAEGEGYDLARWVSEHAPQLGEAA